jgi:hypothetical protein
VDIAQINYLLDNFDNIDWTKEKLDNFVTNLKNLNLETLDLDCRNKITEFLKKVEVQENSKNIQDDSRQELNKTEQSKDKIVPAKENNKLQVLISIIVFLALIGGGIIAYKLLSSNNTTKIVLNGDTTVTLEVNSQYKELGAKVENSNDKKIDDKIMISGEIDVSKLGTYEILYSVTDNSTNTVLKTTRTIKVIDSTSPIIKLNGADSITVEEGNTYNELSAIVTDNYDKDIQNKLVILGNVDTTKVGEYTITYSASDASGNKSDIIRTVNVVYTVQLLETEMTNLVGQYYNQLIKGRITGVNNHIVTISELSSRGFNISKLIDPVTGEQCKTSSYSNITVVEPMNANSEITIENHLDCGSYQSSF